MDLGFTGGMVKKAGSFFSYGEIRLGQGRENAKAYLKQNEDIALKLEQEIRDAPAIVSIPVRQKPAATSSS